MCSIDNCTDTSTTSGDISKILNQYHGSQSVIWWAKIRNARGSQPSYAVFVPGNRTYGVEATQPGTKHEAFRELRATLGYDSITANSTGVRRLFFCHESRGELINALKSLVINPELLAMYLGVND